MVDEPGTIVIALKRCEGDSVKSIKIVYWYIWDSIYAILIWISED